ncbi:MAG: NAD(+)/NADH kinase, partial [Pseudomonadota bacterium]
MPSTFRRVALIGKQTPEIAQSLRALRELLRKRGCEVMVESETANSVGDGDGSASFEEIGRGADLAIVVGGDGTMLAAARNLVRHHVPLAGVNQGRLGFMTDIALGDMRESVGAILEGRHSIEERALLDVELVREGRPVLRTVALNEAVLTKGSQGRLIEFELRIDGEYVYTLRADGVIVATPTGSTAYALSAQGPILQPTVAAFALVPLNPHVLSARPVSVSDRCAIEIG